MNYQNNRPIPNQNICQRLRCSPLYRNCNGGQCSQAPQCNQPTSCHCRPRCPQKIGCQKQEQGNLRQCQGDQTQELGDQVADQGDQAQIQGLSEAQGGLAAAQGGQDQIQGLSEVQGGLAAAQGGQDQIQGLSEAQGGLAAAQGGQDQIQGLSEAQGGLAAAQGGQDQIQGLSEAQGGLAAAQGGQDQIQGLNEAQGGLAAAQGGQDQIQGLSEVQGGLAAAQGGQDQIQGLNEAQGGLIAAQGPQRQKQGNLCESLGDQGQLMTGHGGQCQGDQMLLNTPSVCTPISVKGLNIDVDCGCHRRHHDCCEIDRKIIAWLLLLLKACHGSIQDPEAEEIRFYTRCRQEQPLVGHLEDIMEAFFTLTPSGEGEIVTVMSTALEALELHSTEITNDLFSLLLKSLESLPDAPYKPYEDGYSENLVETIWFQLQNYMNLHKSVQINTESMSFTGYIFGIKNGIVILVDHLDEPILIHAIPLRQIVSCQVQENEI